MAIQTKKIFIDSSLLLAFIDRSEPNHQKSVKIMENLAKLNYQIYTSAQNISETYTALAREIGLSVALEFLHASLQSDMEILFPQKADFITAHKFLKTNRDRQVSLKEALNATLMQKRGIIQVLTFTYWHNLFGTYVTNIATS